MEAISESEQNLQKRLRKSYSIQIFTSENSFGSINFQFKYKKTQKSILRSVQISELL
jgi:hypothetical protein